VVNGFDNDDNDDSEEEENMEAHDRASLRLGKSLWRPLPQRFVQISVRHLLRATKMATLIMLSKASFWTVEAL